MCSSDLDIEYQMGQGCTTSLGIGTQSGKIGCSGSSDILTHHQGNTGFHLIQFTSGNQGFYKQGVELVCRIEIIGLALIGSI